MKLRLNGNVINIAAVRSRRESGKISETVLKKCRPWNERFSYDVWFYIACRNRRNYLLGRLWKIVRSSETTVQTSQLVDYSTRQYTQRIWNYGSEWSAVVKLIYCNPDQNKKLLLVDYKTRQYRGKNLKERNWNDWQLWSTKLGTCEVEQPEAETKESAGILQNSMLEGRKKFEGSGWDWLTDTE